MGKKWMDRRKALKERNRNDNKGRNNGNGNDNVDNDATNESENNNINHKITNNNQKSINADMVHETGSNNKRTTVNLRRKVSVFFQHVIWPVLLAWCGSIVIALIFTEIPFIQVKYFY